MTDYTNVTAANCTTATASATIAGIREAMKRFDQGFGIHNEKKTISCDPLLPIPGVPFGAVGLRTYSCSYMTDTLRTQIRFPRSKKKRIRRKWAKQVKNWKTETIPKPEVYMVNGTLVAHPEVLKGVCEELNRRMESRIAREIFK
jgi:hypothetical protein